MPGFIAQQIKKQADISSQLGIEKYRTYFVNMKNNIYEEYREATNIILIRDGYDRIIQR